MKPITFNIYRDAYPHVERLRAEWFCNCDTIPRQITIYCTPKRKKKTTAPGYLRTDGTIGPIDDND